MDEPGSEIMINKMDYAIMSSVSYSEVMAVLSRKMTIIEISEILNKLITRIEPFTREDAINAGLLYEQTKQYGLSLGDRACIALGQRLGLEVYTADKIWSELDCNAKIIVIRC